MTSRLNNPYRTPQRVCICSGPALVATSVLALYWLSQTASGVNDQSIMTLVLLMLIALGGGLTVGGILLWLVSKRIDSLIERMASGESAIHWTYSTEEWTTFQALEKTRRARGFLRSPIFQILPYMPLSICVYFVAWWLLDGRDLKGHVLAASGACVFFLIVIPLAWLFRVIIPRRRDLRQINSQPPDTYLHPLYGYGSNRFLYGILSDRLTGVSILKGEIDCLELTVTKPGLRAGELLEYFRVPIPGGKMGEAFVFVQQTLKSG